MIRTPIDKYECLSIQVKVPLWLSSPLGVYEEWPIVKRNRFGRRQERIFGVDANFVYNIAKGRKASDRMYVKVWVGM